MRIFRSVFWVFFLVLASMLFAGVIAFRIAIFILYAEWRGQWTGSRSGDSSRPS